MIRKDTCDFVGDRAERISANLPPREAETAALKEVLSWTKEPGMRKCIFETDAKMLADACRGVSGRLFFHTIVSNCVEFFKHFDEVLVEYVLRSANSVAHTLARATHSMSDLQESMHVALKIISDVLIY